MKQIPISFIGILVFLIFKVYLPYQTIQLLELYQENRECIHYYKTTQDVIYYFNWFLLALSTIVLVILIFMLITGFAEKVQKGGAGSVMGSYGILDLVSFIVCIFTVKFLTDIKGHQVCGKIEPEKRRQVLILNYINLFSSAAMFVMVIFGMIYGAHRMTDPKRIRQMMRTMKKSVGKKK